MSDEAKFQAIIYAEGGEWNEGDHPYSSDLFEMVSPGTRSTGGAEPRVGRGSVNTTEKIHATIVGLASCGLYIQDSNLSGPPTASLVRDLREDGDVPDRRSALLRSWQGPMQWRGVSRSVRAYSAAARELKRWNVSKEAKP
jgi:hypothetical protein